MSFIDSALLTLLSTWQSEYLWYALCAAAAAYVSCTWFELAIGLPRFKYSEH